VRRLLVALLLASAPAVASEVGPLPGEVVTRIGQVAALPADARKVPGYAGAWRRAAAQQQVIERIQALEARGDKPCRAIEVTDTVQAAPDLIETRPQRVHHALERWTVQACGTTRVYDVWYRFESGASRLVVADSGANEFQAVLDPPYRRLRELAATRQAEEAGGGVRWLNLPLPADSMPVANHSGKDGWSADFVPLGDAPREWTQLIGVQGLPRSPQPGQAVRVLEGMQEVRARRCGVPAGAVEALLPEASASGAAQTFLVCPQVPGTNYAELAVVKAIEGPDQLYVVQRAWRLPAGKADALVADSRGPRSAAEAFLAQVRLCNPAVDRSACPAAYPR
jgi:hypothetical protein